MPIYTIHIKNMVCPRCISAVKEVFKSLSIHISSIQLGEVTITETLDTNTKEQLGIKLSALGFELLIDQKSKLIAKIKSLIIDQIHHKKETLKVNFSTYLAEEINQDYSSLSRLFSSVESITIEKFITMQKVEKVKELICYKELTLSEIADEMGYSSISHLSAQFKKETGMSPSLFRKSVTQHRKSLDAI